MDDAQFNALLDGSEGHRFCYIYWEHGGSRSSTSLYYQDAPHRGKTPAAHKFSVPKPNDEYLDFIAQMKRAGWQQYMGQANPEVYEFWLMRALDAEPGYEYCAYSRELPGGRPGSLSGVYTLGAANNYVSAGWNTPPQQILDNLNKEGWTLTHEEEFPSYSDVAGHSFRMSFYRRPLKA